jgi:succinoglycan biosynthesis transport protein ExoP
MKRRSSQQDDNKERQRYPMRSGGLGLSSEEARRSLYLPYDFDQFGATQPDDQEGMLDTYASTFKRHRRTILKLGIAGCALGLLFGVASLPVYSTRTSVDIRSLNHDFLNMRDVAPTETNNSADEDTNFQTQIKLLGSETLLQQTADRVLSEVHPAFILRNDLLSRFERLLHMGGHDPILYTELVDNTVHSVTVKPIGLTRLVEVRCSSYDAAFAAHFCNTLVTVYQEEDLRARAGEARKTSEWLTQQVADVREHAQEAQQKLEQAMGGNGLMLSQTTTATGEDRLHSLQDELVKAEADRMLQQAQTRVDHTAAASTLPEVQDNPEHRAYELRLADLNNQLAQLVPTLTEQNPKVIRLRAEIATAREGLLEAEAASTGRQDSQLAAAQHRESLLRIAYQTQESTVSQDLQKAAQISLMRKEVDSEQNLYQTLLERAKEAGFASAMQATTLRVVDLALTPRIAASPQRKLAAIVGLILGSLLGVGFAFFRERNIKVFRSPGDPGRILNIPELGVIPNAASFRPSGGKVKSPMLAMGVEADSRPVNNALALTGWDDAFSIAAEAYRNTTLSIMLSETSDRARVYVVSSPCAGEGKTTVTSNLAVALSRSRLRVVLVDGDLRRPTLHRVFGLTNGVGLRNILKGEVDLESVAVESFARQTGIPNISMVTAGEGVDDVVQLLHSHHLGDLLKRLSQSFDVVLIDTPPTLHMADARILAGQSNGAILVLRAGTTERKLGLEARDLLDRDDVRIVGSVLNDFDAKREGYAGYYESYMRYSEEQRLVS